MLELCSCPGCGSLVAAASSKRDELRFSWDVEAFAMFLSPKFTKVVLLAIGLRICIPNPDQRNKLPQTEARPTGHSRRHIAKNILYV